MTEIRSIDGAAALAKNDDLIAALQRSGASFEDARTLPAATYTSTALYAVEQCVLFGRMWLCVGREADVMDPGGYFTCAVAGEKLLLVRGDDGRLRAFFNVCRHRGAQLVADGRGALRGALACPYHAWTYSFDGELLRVPHGVGGFDRAGHGLLQARLEIRHGFVFVAMAESAPPLTEYLAGLPDFSAYELGRLQSVHRLEYDVAANWKIICENYSECYHCALVHPQLHRISDITSGTFRSGANFNGGPMRLREGFNTMSMSGVSDRAPMPALGADEHRLVHYYLLYPNFAVALHPDYVMTHSIWPIAPERSRVVCDFLFREEVVRDPGFDPADSITFWDRTNREDWTLCGRVQEGARSRGYRPGIHQESERCVHAFDRWYATHMLDALRAS